jgi:predicted DNA-binding transcriptional regulator AlpA
MPRSVPMARLLTCRDVAAFLGVTTRTVWRWTADGTLPPPLRKGRRFARWRPEDLRQALIRLRCPAVDATHPAALLRQLLAQIAGRAAAAPPVTEEATCPDHAATASPTSL